MTQPRPGSRLTYKSIGTFYDERGGLTSPESDYGGYNWDDGHLHDCIYCISRPWACPGHRLRVSYVHQTGDWYAISPHNTGTVLFLGRITLAGKSEPEVHHHFFDWAQGETPGRPLSWFLNRIHSWNELQALEEPNRLNP